MTAKQQQQINSKLAECRDAIRLRHLAISTEETYLGWLLRYMEWLTAHGRDFATSELRIAGYLTSMAHRGVTASTQNQAFNAILFFYRHVLREDLKDINALRAKRPAHIRTAPSREIVKLLLDNVKDVHGYPTRLVTFLLYGCGLRVSEPLNLRIKDIDLAGSKLIIRGAKGGKDRKVTIPCSLVPAIQRQMRAARVQWEADQVAGMPVEIPGGLARKYPRAPFSWQWAWFLPSRSTCQHPRTEETVRFRMHEANVQRAVKAVAQSHDLEGTLTPHNLRHAFADHTLQQGGNIRDLQAVLGHAHLNTTMIYVHAEAERLRSPLDALAAIV